MLKVLIRLNEKDVPLPTTTPSIAISKTQPNTSEKEISETSEEEPEVCDKMLQIQLLIYKLRHYKSLYHVKIYEHRKI